VPLSRFLRTTWILNASASLDLAEDGVAIRRISEVESDDMTAMARKRNVFARHSWENNFYIERIGQLRGTTVLEVFLPGSIDEVLEEARTRAEYLERVALVSAIFAVQRQRMLQMLGIGAHRQSGFDLAISPGFEFLRSTARPESRARGVPVDTAFERRFVRDGFLELLRAGYASTGLRDRLKLSVRWLSESRQETELTAAIVKSAIALESLLIANEVENLRGPLAERTAFLLSDDSAMRERIAKVIRKFYDIRSSIVHGGRRRPIAVPVQILEGVERLTALVAVTLAANRLQSPTFDAVVEVVNKRKWGDKLPIIRRPFRSSALSWALKLSEGRARGSA